MSAPTAPIRLVAVREIKQRLRTRSMKVSTLFAVLIVCGGIALPGLRGDRPRTYDVGLVGDASEAMVTAIGLSGLAAEATVKVAELDDVDEARAALGAGRLDLVVALPDTIIVDRALPEDNTTRRARFVRTVAEAVRLQGGLEREGLAPERAAAALATPAPTIESLRSASVDSETPLTILFGVILLYMLLLQYGTWVLSGVVEEKLTRVVEVLLSTITARQLLVGKVVGIGVVAFGQAMLLLVAGTATALITGSDFLAHTSLSAVWVLLLWFLLGYSFYCCLYAAAGSLVARQEDAQNASFPISMPLIASYLLSFTILTGGDPSPVVRALAYFPPTAPFLVPVLYAAQEISLAEIAISAAITIVGIVVVVRLAAAIYARAVLRTGQKIGWRQALHLGET